MSSRCRRRSRSAFRGLVGVIVPGALGAIAACPLGGCVANSSNPAVEIRSARMDDAGATLDLALTNPGGRDLTVTGVTYDVSHGESSFPVANGAWSGSLDLPAKGTATLTLDVPFDTPPLEADSTLLHVNGELSFVDRTGFLGIGAMDLTKTSFRGTVTAVRGRK